MELSLKVSGKHLGIATAVIATVTGIGLGYRSYVHHKENEAALAAFNQQVASFDHAFAAQQQEFANMSNLSTAADAAAATAAAAASDAGAAAAAAAVPIAPVAGPNLIQ
jgi:Tfp pilus assembly protein PilE